MNESFFYFQSFFATRFFALFDVDENGNVDIIELIEGLQILKNGTPTQKLMFLFNVFDTDGNYITSVKYTFSVKGN